MKLKHTLLTLTSVLLVMLSTSSFAGRSGVNFYYGLGLGGVSTKFYDATATASAIIGFEEDGWMIEGVSFASVEAGTDDPETDYSIRGVDVGLGYRTLEKNKRYYTIKYSKTDLELTEKDTDPVTNITTTFTGDLDANAYSIGMGFRTQREARMEVTYSYVSVDGTSDPIHLISFSYLWGGTPYQGRDL